MARRQKPEKLPLFDRPILSDWLLWVGLVLTGVVAFNSAASTYRDPDGELDIEAYGGMGAFVFDLAFAAALMWLIFGLLPASIRRARRRKRGEQIPPRF
jgi:hypothetical protein